MKMVARKGCIHRKPNHLWSLMKKKERDRIEEWRIEREKDAFRPYEEYFTFSLDLETLKSFLNNLGVMTVVHITMSALMVFLFQRLVKFLLLV